VRDARSPTARRGGRDGAARSMTLSSHDGLGPDRACQAEAGRRRAGPTRDPLLDPFERPRDASGARSCRALATCGGPLREKKSRRAKYFFEALARPRLHGLGAESSRRARRATERDDPRNGGKSGENMNQKMQIR
jgi:hypothetical protein